MNRRGFLWQIIPAYLLINILSLIAVGWFASNSYRDFFLQKTEENLTAKVKLVKDRFIPHMQDQNLAKIDSLCSELSNLTNVRLTVIGPDSEVWGDSEKDPETMDDHSDRPEVIRAQREGKGAVARYSYTLDTKLKYVAIPIEQQGRNLGVVRASITLNELDRALGVVINKIIVAGIVVALIIAGIGIFISRKISRPLEEMRQGADRFANQDFSRKIPSYNSMELNSLSESMNKMAQQLNDRIQTILSQRNEMQAVLSSMVEGVLAIDSEERLIGFNRAAGNLLKIKESDTTGRTLHEIVRNIDLQRFVSRVLNTREPIEEEIMIRTEDGESYLQLHGTVLRNGEGSRIGALVVLNDVTRLHRLEAVRRDFVANVSHELKTPVTSIKGFVETLLDGALSEPESCRKFLDVIARQADRLHAIIEDLLTLSRMEQEAGRTKISMHVEPIKPVIKTAVQVCEFRAQQSSIRIKVHCPEDISAPINAPLLEQAVINLLDNAIKYSEPDSVIAVSVSNEDKMVVIRVTDRGCGIAREHLPRLFERFYIIDKARSRKLGGTGLGLAIVKHIAQAHGGYPSVESTPGKGSTFSINIKSGQSGDARNQM